MEGGTVLGRGEGALLGVEPSLEGSSMGLHSRDMDTLNVGMRSLRDNSCRRVSHRGIGEREGSIVEVSGI